MPPLPRNPRGNDSTMFLPPSRTRRGPSVLPYFSAPRAKNPFLPSSSPPPRPRFPPPVEKNERSLLLLPLLAVDLDPRSPDSQRAPRSCSPHADASRRACVRARVVRSLKSPKNRTAVICLEVIIMSSQRRELRWEWMAGNLHACYVSADVGRSRPQEKLESAAASGRQAGRQVVSRKPEVNLRLSWPEAD